MEEFKKYVDRAMLNAEFTSIRPVVEKELLHYEIFDALDAAGLLSNIVFQGGTSLRLCRNSPRFSEDLDFAGGSDFDVNSMKKIKECIIDQIGSRFGLNVTVKEPKLATGKSRVSVEKWMIGIETSPGSPDIPKQKIKIEIANIPAYSSETIPLTLNYDVLSGRNQVFVRTESLNEILADKIVALPASMADYNGTSIIPVPSRTRFRDIWDLMWLSERRASLDIELVNKKISDYDIERFDLLQTYTLNNLESIIQNQMFKAQMRRFLTKSAYDNTFGRGAVYDNYMISTVTALFKEFSPEVSYNTLDRL